MRSAITAPTQSSRLTPFPNDDFRRPVVAFTTPQNYALRLSHLLQLKGWIPLWSPTVIVETTPQTRSSIHRFLSFPDPNPDKIESHHKTRTLLEQFSAIAFTSRAGISALSESLMDVETPPLSPSGDALTVAALGRDSELLDESFINRICSNRGRIEVLIPPVATPAGLIDSLGVGRGRKVLCPVPKVIGIGEPPVVPNFLRDLGSKGWVPIRVNAYETRWGGPKCAEEVARRVEEEECGLDAIVFTSTGEVEGLLKSLKEFGMNWDSVRKRCPWLVVAAHGPVTAAGAEKLGVEVDLVSSKFDSFDGVVDALSLTWHPHSNL